MDHRCRPLHDPPELARQRPQTVAEWRSALLDSIPTETRTEKVAPPVAPPPKPKAAPPRLAAEVLKRAEQRLAEYIGAGREGGGEARRRRKARDEAELYLLIADEIKDKAERKKAFTRQAVSISGKPAS